MAWQVGQELTTLSWQLFIIAIIVIVVVISFIRKLVKAQLLTRENHEV